MKIWTRIYIVLLGFSLLIHFILKDNFYWSSILFYALPLPIIIVFNLLLLPLSGPKFRKHILVALGLLLITWSFQSLVFNFQATEKADLDIVYWNAGHTQGFEEAFNQNENTPDVMVLVEYDTTDYKSIRLKYPDFHFYLSKEGIGICSKQQIKNVQEQTSPRNSTVLKFETYNLQFFALDVTPNVFNFRKSEFEFLNKHINNKNKAIVLGDFNTPLESVYLKKFKRDYQHAFTESGIGFKETWFWNLPILSLDHIWISKDLKILKTKKIHGFKSDHSMIKTQLKF
jgi:endonuclease/exonuclease/phosphatase family metal-dependent hydrolase